MQSKDKQKIFEFIKQHHLAVLSTVSSQALPNAAVIGFSETENLEIIFGTSRDTKKYENLKARPRVALVIGWDHGKTVQYHGTAHELQGTELDEFKQKHLAKVPTAAKYVASQYQAYFKISPIWVRYSDTSKDPWETVELKLSQ